MRKFLLPAIFLSCAATVANPVKAGSNEPVSRTFIEKGDVTGDGKPETLILQINGASMQAPFTWSFTIKDSNEKTIYRIERNDASLDDFFKSDDYETECKGYVDCKKRYYFHDVPKTVFSVLQASSRNTKLDQDDIENLKMTAGAYLQKHGVSKASLGAVLEEMRRILEQSDTHSLMIPLSAVEDDPPQIWVPSVKQF